MPGTTMARRPAKVLGFTAEVTMTSRWIGWVVVRSVTSARLSVVSRMSSGCAVSGGGWRVGNVCSVSASWSVMFADDVCKCVSECVVVSDAVWSEFAG